MAPPLAADEADEGSSDGGSDMADFVIGFGSDSDDGELPAAAVPAASPSAREPAREPATAPEPEPEPEMGPELEPKPEMGAELQQEPRGDDTIWSVLQASFRRSDAPRQVAEAFVKLSGWQTAPVQELLWDRVLSERAAGGAGSREYVTAVLKAVVSHCDAARAEVSERLIDELLLLQSGAASKRVTAEEQACSDAAGSSSSPPAPEPEPEPEPAQPYAVPAPVPGAPHLLQPRHIISLGTDCFGRTVASRLGFMRRRLEGYCMLVLLLCSSI